MRIFMIFFFLVISLFATEKKDIMIEKMVDQKYDGQLLSKKQLAYERWKKALAKENKELEEDGFCACNNY